MSEAGPVFIQSRDNALVKDLRRLAQDNGDFADLQLNGRQAP